MTYRYACEDCELQKHHCAGQGRTVDDDGTPCACDCPCGDEPLGLDM